MTAPTRRPRAALAGVIGRAAVVCWAPLCAGLLGCLEPPPTLLSIPVEWAGTDALVELDSGWTLELDQARVTVADLRLEGPAESPSVAFLQRLSPISVAHAHPGHDFAGQVGGELLGSWSLDLLAPQALGEARVFTAPFATARFELDDSLELVLAGTAHGPAGEARPFDLVLAVADDVSGLPFEVVVEEDTPPAAIELQVHLAHALSFCDWATDDEDADGLLTVADGLLAHTLLFGVSSTSSWSLLAR